MLKILFGRCTQQQTVLKVKTVDLAASYSSTLFGTPNAVILSVYVVYFTQLLLNFIAV